MLVIGFDPGSQHFGVGVLQKEKNQITYLYSENIHLQETDFNQRMRYLWQRLQLVYREYPPNQAAIEEGFLGKNVKSMAVLAKVRGLVLASVITAGIELFSYSPRQIKLALTGCGSADKSQVNKMIKTLLNIRDRKITSDESDALATAYCHLLSL